MDVGNHLQNLEKFLLADEGRKDLALAGLLLAEEFKEYGSSGRIYSKREVLEALRLEAPGHLSSADFEVSLLTQSTALITYRAIKNASGSPSFQSLRSSLWVLRNERWQMLFHQGTPIPPTPGV